MENEHVNNTENSYTIKEQATTVTPLSKYLALFLFIILPFIGGYLGYKFSPEKIVEIERIVEVEKKLTVEETSNDLVETITTETDLWERYIHPAGFALMIPAEAHVQDSFEKITVKDIYGYLDVNIHYRENLGGIEKINSYIAQMYGADCEVKLENEDIIGYGVSTYSIFGSYPGYTGDCRNGKRTKLLYSHINDLAVTWVGSYDAGNHSYMLETIHISTSAYGE